MFQGAGVQYLLRELESHWCDCSDSLGEDAAVVAQPAERSEGLPSTSRRAGEKPDLQPGCPGLVPTAAVKFRRRKNWPLAAG